MQAEQTITPMLWFDGQAEAAAERYVAVFNGRPGGDPSGSRITEVSRYTEAGPGEPGSAMTVAFELEGQAFSALNGGPEFSFNESVSFVVRCETQDEVDHFWNALTADGGEESMCGWLKDRHGLSWQITPTALMELLSDPDPERARRAMEAMFKMQKIDIAELRRAAEAA
ncbi:MAG TPA: VOC family protein [Actinomycetota bacterium]|jgi:predicted 3-demethylubiquinone-9 3-methyltransferase (glyoxalase superfamily)